MITLLQIKMQNILLKAYGNNINDYIDIIIELEEDINKKNLTFSEILFLFMNSNNTIYNVNYLKKLVNILVNDDRTNHSKILSFIVLILGKYSCNSNDLNLFLDLTFMKKYVELNRRNAMVIYTYMDNENYNTYFINNLFSLINKDYSIFSKLLQSIDFASGEEEDIFYYLIFLYNLKEIENAKILIRKVLLYLKMVEKTFTERNLKYIMDSNFLNQNYKKEIYEIFNSEFAEGIDFKNLNKIMVSNFL